MGDGPQSGAHGPRRAAVCGAHPGVQAGRRVHHRGLCGGPISLGRGTRQAKGAPADLSARSDAGPGDPLDQPACDGGGRLISRGGAVFPRQGRGDRLSGASRTADGSQGHSPRRPEPGCGPAAVAGFRRQPRRPQHQSGAPRGAAATPADLPGRAYQWTIGLAGDRGCGNADCGGARGHRWPIGRPLSPVSLSARRDGAGVGSRRPGDRPGRRIGVGRISGGRLAQHPGALPLRRAAPGRQRGLPGRPRCGADRA